MSKSTKKTLLVCTIALLASNMCLAQKNNPEQLGLRMIIYSPIGHMKCLVLILCLFACLGSSADDRKIFKRIAAPPHVIEKGGKSYFVHANMKNPKDYPNLDSLLARVIFSDSTATLQDAYAHFLERHHAQPVSSGATDSYYRLVFRVDFIYPEIFGDQSVIMVNALFPVVYPSPKTGSIVVNNDKVSFLYSLTERQVLNCTDIFKPAAVPAVSNQGLCDGHYFIKDASLVFVPNGGGDAQFLSLLENAENLSEGFQRHVKWDVVKELETKFQQAQADRQKTNDSIARLREEMIREYGDIIQVGAIQRRYEGGSAKNEFPHLFLLNKEYKLSTTGENIMQLTDTDIAKLPSEVRNDIVTMKQYVTSSYVSATDSIYTNPDVMPSLSGKHKSIQGVILNSPSFLSWLNHSKTIKGKAGFYAGIQFVVETDGSISAPVVYDLDGVTPLDFVKHVMEILRKTNKWVTGSINGKPVRTLVRERFSYKHEKQHNLKNMKL